MPSPLLTSAVAGPINLVFFCLKEASSAWKPRNSPSNNIVHSENIHVRLSYEEIDPFMLRCIKSLQESGLKVLCDAILNHRCASAQVTMLAFSAYIYSLLSHNAFEICLPGMCTFLGHSLYGCLICYLLLWEKGNSLKPMCSSFLRHISVSKAAFAKSCWVPHPACPTQLPAKCIGHRHLCTFAQRRVICHLQALQQFTMSRIEMHGFQGIALIVEARS